MIPALFTTRSPMSTESILGSHHVFFQFVCFVGLIYFTLHFPTPLHLLVSIVCARDSVFFLRPAEFGQSQLLAFVRSRAYAKNTLSIEKNILSATSSCPYQHVKSTSASPNTLDFCIWKLSVAASASGVLSPDPSR